MARSAQQPAPPVEVFGPMDLRPIGPDLVNPTATDFAAALRRVMPEHGHRAAVTASLAAVLAGVTVLAELSGDGTVADVLRDHLATAERKIAARAAGTHKRGIH